GGKTLFSREFGSALARRIREMYPDDSFDAVVPVPLHYSRVWRRGYNQAALIAAFLADALDVPCYTWLLSRVRRTRPQSGGRIHRLKNVRGAFHAGGKCTHASILLVDDVLTTGATMRESAAVLYGAGADRVVASVCAWVPLGHYHTKEHRRRQA
ncbi:ComF family protein, partial [bacterium]|nr:ComF family protein [candidate division CSSED10-310 bacterium]